MRTNRYPGWRPTVVIGCLLSSAALVFGSAVEPVAADQGDAFAPSGPPTAVGTTPFAVIVAALPDGPHQLLTANLGSDDTTILAPDGNGGMTTTGPPIPVGEQPVAAAAADLNGDSEPDVVVANIGSGDVSVLLGQSGRLEAAPNSPVQVGADPRAVGVADLNGDRLPDVAVANAGSDDLSILLGDGSGRFAVATTVPLGASPFGLVLVDLDGDGDIDLGTANENNGTISVGLNDGTAQFSTGDPIPVGTNPFEVVAADVDADGHLDLATANGGSNDISIVLGDGSGHFTPAESSLPTGGSVPCSLITADLNGDGHADLATVNADSENVSVLFGDGNGAFTAAAGSPFPVGSAPRDIVPVDVNGDGRADLVTANSGSNDLTVLLRQTSLPESLTTVPPVAAP